MTDRERNALLHGFMNAFTLFPDVHNPISQTDEERLRSDWENISKDLRVAIYDFDANKKEESAVR